MIQILLEWTPSHHPGDGRGTIESHLAAGLDEGPLLVVGCDLGRRPRGRGDALIFADVNNYLSHLAIYDGELADERWVGLVRESRADQATALAALFQIKERVTPARTPKLNRPGGREPRKVFDYAVLIGPHITTEAFKIVSTGDGANEVAAAFPAMADFLNFDHDGSA
jgi:hypothetical protein